MNSFATGISPSGRPDVSDQVVTPGYGQLTTINIAGLKKEMEFLLM